MNMLQKWLTQRKGIKEGFKEWKEAVSIRKGKRQRITAVILALVYLGLWGASVYYEGFSAPVLLIMIGLCLLCLSIYLVDAPVLWIFRLLIGLFIPAAVFILLESYTHEFDTLVDNAVRLNLLLYYFIYLVVALVSGRFGFACAVTTSFFMVCGIANYFVMEFRSAPIVPWDFYSLGTAMSVADNYSFQITQKFAVISCMLFSLIIISLRIGLHFKYHIIRGFATAVLACIGGWFLAYLWNPDTVEAEGLNNSLFVSSNMYKADGFMLAFTMNLRYLNLEPPEGYNKEEAKQILESQTVEEKNPTVLPDIIVVMSETFSDLSVLGNFETNMDYMPFIHSLMDGADNTISGNLYVSVLGGNTANSEFEFLTGNTMKFFPVGSVPYQQYIHSDVLTIVDQLKELGYHTLAMHPYRATGWNRNKVYPLMHFDHMQFYTDVEYKKKLRNYVSDESNYKNLLKSLDESEEPLFLMNVTMQNHSAYGSSYDNFTPQITAEFKNTKSNKYLNNYLSLIYETDIATEAFIKELEEREDPVIVVFFGDHQPNDYVVKPIYKEHGLDIDNQTLEQQQKRQITPFFIWANFDIKEQSGISISTNYLSNLLMETLGFELSEYQTYLKSVIRTLPVMNAVGYFDARGNCKNYSDMSLQEQEVLDTYEKVQYYRMFEK